MELIKNVLHPICAHVLVDGLDPNAIYVCWLLYCSVQSWWYYYFVLKKQFVVHHVELIKSAHHLTHAHVRMDGLDLIAKHVSGLHNSTMIYYFQK